MNNNPLDVYGAWIAGVPDAWPDDARDWAHREWVDTVAVMVPGAVEPVAQKLFATVAAWGLGPCTVFGQQQRLAAPWAALVNGTIAHALDFDDNFDPPKAHPTTVLLPAIMAVAEERALSGAACIDAYIVGLQILGRIGQGLNPTHRNRGWHATATVGVMGATAAVCRLLQLDAEACTRALSIATSMSAGFMSQFGTEMKPVHAGLAAKGGIMAAHMAEAGITAGRDTLDGRTGMNRLMVGPDYEDLRDSITHVEHGQNLRFELESVGQPLLITEHKFRVKRFPTCGAIHRAMDGVLDLMAAHQFTATEVASVDLHMPRVHFNNVFYNDPQSPLEAKFSAEYAVGCVLARGRCSLVDFTEEAIWGDDVRRLFPLIHRHPVDKLEGEFPTEVHITLKDGRQLKSVHEWPKGSKAAPFTWDEYWAKFDECCTGVLDGPARAALREKLAHFPALANADDLMRHAAFAPGAAH
ncbi:MmgE/PrpD family protein [Altererythrobacter sp. KTW20L]|uniref:MmgE/PrpD family protein n=1 Tax=Altererythrobacter sp. KTW20L TaxID=2942210 RepID=UPI0020C1746D|nr:MmgE/PrpD family protein [Altererythrobacter sp. KTW20L]